jgi:hypothetical protein
MLFDMYIAGRIEPQKPLTVFGPGAIVLLNH